MPPEDEKGKEEQGKEAQGKEQQAKESAGVGLTPEQTRAALAYVLNQNKTLATELAQLRGEFATVKEGKQPVRDNKESVDLETMPRADFANFILEQVKERLVKPAVERVAVKEEEDEKKQLRREIQEFSGKRPEFWAFADEVKQVLSKHPELNIEEAFAIAKDSAPDKARKMDEAAIEARRKEEEKKVAERRQSFGGLLPTSGRTTKATGMKPKDAAEQAWQDTGMSDHLAAIASE